MSERFKPAMAACERCQAVYFKRRPWARFCSKVCKDAHPKETAEANERDAKRYRWLRAGDPCVFVFNSEAGRIEGDALDAVVDGGINGA